MGKYNHKPKRLENRAGCISKLSGVRRKPWRARAFVSCIWNEEKGKYVQVYKTVGHYKTYAEAENALYQYNQNPYDLDSHKITFGEVFERWNGEAYPTMSQSNIQSYNAAYKVCKEIENRPFVEIRYQELQHVIDESGKNYPTLRKIHLLFAMLYKWGMKNELITTNQAQFVDIRQYKDKNPNKIDRLPFTNEEIETLWKWSEKNEYVSIILMMIYSGVRQGELRDLKKEDVHLEDRYFYISKSKTPAGIRNVPINEKVFPFFKSWYEKNPEGEYLITTREGQHFNDRNFRDSYFTQVLDQVGIPGEHKPHDTRHTCISLLTVAGVDERIIKKIVGHAGKGVTENVYTHIEMQVLIDAINKI